MTLITTYAFTTVISLLLIAAYFHLIKDKMSWFLILYISVFIVNAGYLWMAASNNLENALMANRVSYLGSVFLPLCMMMIILDACKIIYPKWLKYVLLTISTIVFLIAASGGITDWYYDQVTFVEGNGTGRLLKQYGPMHNLYYIYLFTYLISMAAMIAISWYKKKAFNLKHAFALLAIVFGNILIWLVEQGIDSQFEFLSVSYIIMETFLLMIYGIIQDYENVLEAHINTVDSLPDMDQEQIVARFPQLAMLTSRELEVAIPLLQDKKRKEIAEELCITEHTVKKHTAHIFAKFEVTNRKELHKKLGIK